MQKNPQNLIPSQAADKLIAAHDGNVALLYIWLCRCGDFNADRAARELCLTLAEVNSAYEKLCRMELFADKKSETVQKIQPAEELPEYTAEDIVSRSKTDSGFKAVLTEAQCKLGRVLSTADIKTLFGIYDYLSLPPEVIYMLLTYCIDSFAARYGSGRLPSMRSIEKEAYSWANKEILTLEQAEEYIKNAAERRSKAGQIKSMLGITGRQLTATEAKYVSSWIDMGFEADALAIAYDRTVTNTGALKWGYMNKIVSSWHEKGLHSPEEIEEKDSRTSSVKAANNHRSSVSNDELERLRSIYKKVKNG